MLTFVIYLAVCIRTNYTFLIAGNSTIMSLVGKYEMVFSDPMFSFPAGLFFMMLGKLYADNLVSIKKQFVFTTMFVVFTVLFYIE